jgi:hypothetical protein
MALEAPLKKIFCAKTQKNILLINRLSIRVRNFAPLNEPLNISKIFFILTPKSPTRRDFIV